MKILIFTEGTIIMHKNVFGLLKQEIIKQVEEKDPSVHDYLLTDDRRRGFKNSEMEKPRSENCIFNIKKRVK